MKQLIVIFEFKEANLAKLALFKDMLRKYGSYAFITNSTCIIWTNDTAVMVRDNLKTGIGYKTEIPPIKNKTTIVLNFKNSMKIMAKTPEP